MLFLLAKKKTMTVAKKFQTKYVILLKKSTTPMMLNKHLYKIYCSGNELIILYNVVAIEITVDSFKIKLLDKFSKKYFLIKKKP